MHSIILKDVKDIIKKNNIKWENLRNSTVLVTGATGMLGMYAVRVLLQLNDLYDYKIKIKALVRNIDKAKKVLEDDINRKDLDLIISDLIKFKSVDFDIDYIINTVSQASPYFFENDPVGTFLGNVIGMENLLNIAKEKNVKSTLYTSSAEMYGSVEGKESIKESDSGYIDVLNPRSCYSEGKRATETLCACYMKQYNLNINIARVGHTYGPGMSITDSRVQSEFCRKVINNENIVMNSDGKTKRAYTYVSDVVSGLFYVLLHGESTAYNISNENNVITIRDLAEIILDVNGNKNLQLELNINENTGSYSPVKYVDINCDKLKLLGWEPVINADDGFNKLISYYKATIK